MKKAKKTKAPQRHSALDRLAAKLRTALRRETKNIIEIGNLLIESRKHLDHGEWQPWVAENSGLSIRTVQNYLNAAEYVARQSKSATVADFTKLAPTVLYWLAAGHYDEQAEAAILAATCKGRVDQDAADAICEALAPPDDDVVDDADDYDDDTADHAEEAPDPEMEAILDGPPPAVPPPAPIPPPIDYALRDFNQAISELKRLMTKPAAQFADSAHSANDLEAVESFLRAVTKAKATPADDGLDIPESLRRSTGAAHG